MPYNYISEAGMQLTQSQKDLLTAIEKAPCKLDEFYNIYDLRIAKGYEVVVSDRASFRETLKKELDAYDRYYDKKSFLRQTSDRHSLMDQCLSRIIEEKKWNIQKILERIDGTVKNHPLLGLYRSYDYSYNSPVIYLFKENIDAHAGSNGKNPDNVFGFVYVHEAMHAYYNSKNTKGYHSVTELEEAFAECGMIEFFKRTDPAFKDAGAAANDDVLHKQYNGPYDYGFGLAMFELSDSAGETQKIMSRYREISNWIDFSYPYPNDVRHLVRKSQPDSNYDKGAQSCYELVKEILFARKFSQPEIDFNKLSDLEKFMRAAGVTLKPEARTAECGGNATELFTIFYPSVKLMASPSLDDLVYAILKPEEGTSQIESSVNFFKIKTKLEGDTYPGVWMDNTLEFPDGSKRNLQGGWFLDTARCDEPMNAMRLIHFYGRFHILKIENDYILYGPERLQSQYKQIERDLRLIPRKLDLKAVANYYLTDLQGIEHPKLSMTGLVREGIKSYIVKNPSMTAAQLQVVFPKTLGPRNQEVLKTASSIPSNHNTRYDSQIIHTADVDIRINNQWIIAYIRPIIKKFESLGMRVEW